MNLTLQFLASVFLILIVACGKNPFGSGAKGGLELFAKVGQKMERPRSINEEDNSKEGSKEVVQEGVAVAGRLAKKGTLDEDWIIEQGIRISGDTLVYFEIVKDKPSEEDPEKLMTGRAEIRIGYNGTLPATLADLDTTQITDLYSFHFLGRENKTWKKSGEHSQIDSLNITVTFATTGIQDIKPGKTWFWAKNISAVNELGKNDTGSFILDRLDETTHTQYGKGDFLDAHSGRESDGEPKAFGFDIEIIHKNTIAGQSPYLRYQDNEGIIRFALPWGEGNSDSLFFMVHFYPGYQREGTIRKNSTEGTVLARFEYNEKSGNGSVTYYNDEGEEVDFEESNSL